MVTAKEVRQAIEKNNLEHVQRHCDSEDGYTPNSYVVNGSTCFTWAVRKASDDTVTSLLELGAKVNLREKRGATPLLLAIHLNRTEVVRCLIKYKADLNLRDSYDTPLTAAVREGNLDIIRILLDAGASTTECDMKGEPPLIIAIKENKFAIVKLFLELKLGTNVVDADRDTPLIAAIRSNTSVNVIQSLLEHGIDPNENTSKSLPLLWAFNSRKTEIVNVLLDNAANPNLLELADKNTPLIALVRLKFPYSMVECLLKHKVDVNETNNEKTPIAWAITAGSYEVVKLLLSYGANINMLNVGGNTPLATAAECRQLEIAKYLLENNAMIGKFGTNGKTPLSWAVANEDLDMINLLLDHGADYMVHQVFLEAIASENLKVVQLLNEREPFTKTNMQCNKETTPLKASLETDSTEITKYLLESGARVVDLTDKETFWILHFLEKNNTEMVKLLTENGARLNECADCGDTVLTKSVRDGNIEMVKYFLAQGANVNQINRDGLTPLAVAESNNDFKMFQYLVECGANISEEGQESNPNLVMYYQMAKERIARKEQQREIASNQEGA